jgi:hypothetical protein
VGPRRVPGIRGAIFRAVEQENAGGNDGEVHDHPEIFPESVDAFERYGIKGEPAEKGDRRDGLLESRVDGSQVNAQRGAD